MVASAPMMAATMVSEMPIQKAPADVKQAAPSVVRGLDAAAQGVR
jgi:hypothetical protein